MDEWILRLAKERTELANKLNKLETFIQDDNETFKTLQQQDKRLLKQQLQTMTTYYEILSHRLRRTGVEA